MSMVDALLPEFDHEMTTTRKLLERVPDDRLAWKPHEKSMSIGGLATHLSMLPWWGLVTLNDPEFDLAAFPNQAEASSRVQVLETTLPDAGHCIAGWWQAQGVHDGG